MPHIDDLPFELVRQVAKHLQNQFMPSVEREYILNPLVCVSRRWHAMIFPIRLHSVSLRSGDEIKSLAAYLADHPKMASNIKYLRIRLVGEGGKETGITDEAVEIITLATDLVEVQIDDKRPRASHASCRKIFAALNDRGLEEPLDPKHPVRLLDEGRERREGVERAATPSVELLAWLVSMRSEGDGQGIEVGSYEKGCTVLWMTLVCLVTLSIQRDPSILTDALLAGQRTFLAKAGENARQGLLFHPSEPSASSQYTSDPSCLSSLTSPPSVEATG